MASAGRLGREAWREDELCEKSREAERDKGQLGVRI